MKKVLIILGVLLLILNACNSNSDSFVESVNVEESEEIIYQEVSMKFVGSNYIFSPEAVEVGKPVRITADMDTLYGCYKSIVIPSQGIKKYLSEEDNTIIFTPKEIGIIQISCSMGMGVGELKVE